MKAATMALSFFSLLAGPAYAIVGACTTPMESAAICEAGDLVMAWDAPSAALDELALLSDEADLWLATLASAAMDRRSNCTSGAVSLGLCRSSGRQVISIAWDAGIFTALAQRIRPPAWDTVRCSVGSQVVFPGTGSQWSAPVRVDLVATGACTAQQVGEQVPNPMSARRWAWRWIRDSWRDQIRAARLRNARDAAEADVDRSVDVGED